VAHLPVSPILAAESRCGLEIARPTRLFCTPWGTRWGRSGCGYPKTQRKSLRESMSGHATSRDSVYIMPLPACTPPPAGRPRELQNVQTQCKPGGDHFRRPCRCWLQGNQKLVPRIKVLPIGTTGLLTHRSSQACLLRVGARR
jgi:hypothetical protein